MTPRWQREFDADFDVPAVVTDDPDVLDISWHHDAAPSFTLVVWADHPSAPRLWITHPNPALRELRTATPEHRFVVTCGEDYYCEFSDIHDALAHYKALPLKPEPAPGA